MIKNYFKIAWRSLRRNKAHTAINVAGLATGIAASLLIFIVVSYELSYDTFQTNYNRTYRVVTSSKHADGSMDYNPGVPCPAYDALKTDLPQIEKMVALNASSGNQFTILGNNPNNDVAISKKFIEEGRMIFTQPAYFDIFNAKWLAGNKNSLSDPGYVVIDKSTAIKYFGDWKKAEGQFLKMDNTVLLKVSGVVEDMPANTDFPVKIFASYEDFKKYPDNFGYSAEWGSLSSNHQVYFMLPPNVTAQSIQSGLESFVKKHSPNTGRSERMLLLQPMNDFHFNARYGALGDHSSSKTILWTLSLIGVLIIIMASINFINLSTARAIGRGTEVGIRKVLGSSRGQLIRQVMGETFLVVLFALILALGIAKLVMPWLSNVASVPPGISLLTPESGLFLFALMILVTLLSGAYPALVISGFKPALALKNKISAASVGGISLRRALVVTQFAISQVLIIGTIVAVGQMNFVRNADLGFNKDAVLVLPSNAGSNNLSRMAPLKEQLLQNPNIISVSFASDEASSENNWASNFAFDNKEDAPFPVYSKYADEDYAKTFGLQIIAGRNYSANDTVKEYLINETLAKRLGLQDPKLAVGKNLRMGGGQWLPVVGVVKDFKVNSLREEVKPLTIAARKDFYYTIAVKLRTQNLVQTTAQIQKLWEKTYPEYAYTSHFADETIERFYRQETQLSLLYKIFAGIAIFISCLGLYGLVSYMVVQKTKEVGIRKVLGASVSNIVMLFSREFTLLIAIAFLIAVPAGWYMMSGWLQNFVYRIDMGIGVFILAIVASLTIAWITVGYRAIRAALANPVKALRSE